ncbi:MAG: DUF3052 family protein [Phycisphaerales bacterium]|nr:DUF3052 family protein [Phycisphaerales bacterium]MCB9857974.1 DUF3052 family protein [Phycisphaerales bacterium]MCB9864933.1 DUF3052 family protein [Phycisphaerales bacterium]
MAKKPQNPAAAGYSGTPLYRKLGIKAGHRVALVGAPVGIDSQLVNPPENVRLSRGLRGTQAIDVILLFCRKQADLHRNFESARTRLAPAAGLWIAWPKKASGVATDLTEGVVREFGLASGLVDNKVCAIDQTWSGLRFVIRLKDRK